MRKKCKMSRLQSKILKQIILCRKLNVEMVNVETNAVTDNDQSYKNKVRNTKRKS